MGKKVDEAWAALDEEYHIVERAHESAFIEISTEDIHAMRSVRPEIKFEPRLLSHFDNSRSLPKVLRENNLSVLPGDGGYIIGEFNIFAELPTAPDDVPIRHMPIREPRLESLSPENLVNEAMGIAYADYNHFISDFVGCELHSTVSGRHGGGEWEFQIRSRGEMTTLKASRPQIEVDAGFEGDNRLVLLEAKNNLVSEFCLRQLYYPMRAWAKRVDKPITTLFMAISGTDVYLYEYVFPEPLVYDGRMSRSTHYTAVEDTISERDLADCWVKSYSALVREPLDAKFPQANSFTRTVDVIVQIAQAQDETPVDYKSLAELYGFDERQGRYYGDTAVYFGYAEIVGGVYKPTPEGQLFAMMRPRDRVLDLVSKMLLRPVFRESFKTKLVTHETPSQHEVMCRIDSLRPELNITPGREKQSTPWRRAGCVNSWVEYVFNLAKS